MGKKGKGRQCGGFSHKSLKRAQDYEVRQQIEQQLNNSRQRQKSSSSSSSGLQRVERPRLRLAAGGLLRGLMRERQYQETYELMQRRRRNGFLPPPASHANDGDGNKESSSTTESHPAGWILKYPPKPRDDEDDEEVDDSVELSERQGDDGILFPSSTRKTKRHTIPTLQSLCLGTFARHIHDYLYALGRDELHNAVSLLPSDVISELSIMLSTSKPPSAALKASKRNGRKCLPSPPPPIRGITDDLAVVLGKHSHVECLCFRPTATVASASSLSNTEGGKTSPQDTSLTNEGIRELIPRVPKLDEVFETMSIVDNWDDVEHDESDDDRDNEDDYGTHAANTISHSHDRFTDIMQVEGCNLRLRRLELLDCNHLSGSVVLQWFERCCGITHLSLAGSFNRKESHGIEVLKALPRVLPYLEVLDVSRCPTWATPTLIEQVVKEYQQKRKDTTLPPPVAFCGGGGGGSITWKHLHRLYGGSSLPIYGDLSMNTDPW